MSFNKETNKYEGFIYLIDNSINDKKYIGQTTTTLQHRWGQHISSNKNNGMLITKAIHKYGKENFNIIELCKFMSDSKESLLEELNNAEIDYIKKYNSLTPNGYNITKGGNNTSNSLSKPVDCYTLDGDYIMSFDSCSEAERYFNLGSGCVADCCNGETLSTGNKQYTFRFKGDSYDKFDVYHYKRSKYVYKFDLNGNLLGTYSNITQAAISIDENNFKIIQSCISAIIDNPTKTAYGFYWSSTNNFSFNIENYRNRIAVDQYSFDGKKINTYNSVSEACNSLKKSTNNVTAIIKVCNGKSSQAFGYIWRFANDPFDLFDIPIKLQKVKIDRYSISGEFIATYDSYSEALIAIGKNTDQCSNIKKCCDGIRSVSFDNVWRYHGDSFFKYSVDTTKKHFKKSVDQYEKNGTFIRTHQSVKDAGEYVGLKNSSAITQVCKGKRYSAKGYLWIYHGVPLEPVIS